MASVNKVIIVGNLGRDPEVRTLPNGDAVANISVATTDKWKDKQTGEQREAAEWHRVQFFGRLAEIAGEYLRKGSQVYIEGSLRTRKYTDQSGVEKYATEIRADQMQMLGGRQDGQANAPRQEQAPRQSAAPQRNSYQEASGGGHRQAAPARQASSGFDDLDSDIPFISSCMSHDVVTSKARRMARCDF